jgi:gamma-butyrobetaine dioxygenase
VTPAITVVGHIDRGITVAWSDGSDPAMFHHIWLRDNCACSVCRHPQTAERTLDTHSLDPDVRPRRVQHDEGALHVRWNDGHASTFSADWLHEHRYGIPGAGDDLPLQILWDSSVQGALPQIEHGDVVRDGVGLLRFVEQAWTHGVSFVRGAPLTDEMLPALARRVGHLRETNFGVDWHVVAMVEPNNVAYTSIELQPHTDLPNRECPPGFQFLHCLVAEAPGGDSTLVDGFWVAEQIRRDDPAAFELLTTVPVPYRFHDAEHDLRWSAPVIGLGTKGELREVRFHTALAAPLDVAPDLVEPLYRAMRVFDRWCRSPTARVTSHLEPGDVMVFHNRRVLHGRAAFDPRRGRRHLHGVYVDVDEWASRLRMLRAGRGTISI